MLRLLTRAEAAGSKLIIIGDDRQLGAVGPGGSLQALVNRQQSSVRTPGKSVRETAILDPSRGADDPRTEKRTDSLRRRTSSQGPPRFGPLRERLVPGCVAYEEASDGWACSVASR